MARHTVSQTARRIRLAAPTALEGVDATRSQQQDQARNTRDDHVNAGLRDRRLGRLHGLLVKVREDHGVGVTVGHGGLEGAGCGVVRDRDRDLVRGVVVGHAVLLVVHLGHRVLVGTRLAVGDCAEDDGAVLIVRGGGDAVLRVLRHRGRFVRARELEGELAVLQVRTGKGLARTERDRGIGRVIDVGEGHRIVHGLQHVPSHREGAVALVLRGGGHVVARGVIVDTGLAVVDLGEHVAVRAGLGEFDAIEAHGAVGVVGRRGHHGVAVRELERELVLGQLASGVGGELLGDGEAALAGEAGGGRIHVIHVGEGEVGALIRLDGGHLGFELAAAEIGHRDLDGLGALLVGDAGHRTGLADGVGEHLGAACRQRGNAGGGCASERVLHRVDDVLEGHVAARVVGDRGHRRHRGGRAVLSGVAHDGELVVARLQHRHIQAVLSAHDLLGAGDVERELGVAAVDVLEGERVAVTVGHLRCERAVAVVSHRDGDVLGGGAGRHARIGGRLDLADRVVERVHGARIGGLNGRLADLVGTVDRRRGGEVLGGVGDVVERDGTVRGVRAGRDHHVTVLHLEGELAIGEDVVLEGLGALDRGGTFGTDRGRISLVAVHERDSSALVGGLRAVHNGLHRHGAVTVIGRRDLDRVGVGIQHVVLVATFAGLAVLLDGVCVGHTVVGLVEGDGLERVVLHRLRNARGGGSALDLGGDTVLDAELLGRGVGVIAGRRDGEAELAIRHSMVRHLLGDVQAANAVGVVLSGGLVGVCEQASYGCSGHELASHVLYLDGNVDCVGGVSDAAVVTLNLRHRVLVRTSLVIGDCAEVERRGVLGIIGRCVNCLVGVAPVVDCHTSILVFLRHRSVVDRAQHELERIVIRPLVTGEGLLQREVRRHAFGRRRRVGVGEVESSEALVARTVIGQGRRHARNLTLEYTVLIRHLHNNRVLGVVCGHVLHRGLRLGNLIGVDALAFVGDFACVEAIGVACRGARGDGYGVVETIAGVVRLDLRDLIVGSLRINARKRCALRPLGTVGLGSRHGHVEREGITLLPITSLERLEDVHVAGDGRRV